MKTFISDIFPKIQRYSERLDDLTILTNQHWVSVDEIFNSKTVYIFRPNNDLFISKNGNVERARWEYLGNSYLLIDMSIGSYLFKHGFRDRNVLALKLDSSDEHAVFVNETRYEGGELNSIQKVFEFLNATYLLPGRLQLEQTTNEQTVFRETINNQTLKIVSINNETIGAKVYIDNKPAPNGIYIYKALSHKLVINNGVIVERFFLEKFKSFIFEKKLKSEPETGDKVYNEDWTMCSDCSIRYTFLKILKIKHGKVV